MDKKEMRQLIIKALSIKLGGGFSITINEVLKNNFKSDALIIMRDGDNISPAIYLEGYYKELENGVEIGRVADMIIESMSRLKNFSGNISDCIDIRAYLELENVRDKLFVGLINAGLNRELLDDAPHLPFLDDFAVIIRCITGTDDESITSFIVHNSHLKLWGAVKQEESLWRVSYPFR